MPMYAQAAGRILDLSAHKGTTGSNVAMNDMQSMVAGPVIILCSTLVGSCTHCVNLVANLRALVRQSPNCCSMTKALKGTACSEGARLQRCPCLSNNLHLLLVIR